MQVRKSTTVALERRTAAMNDGGVTGRNFVGNAAVFGTRAAIGNPLLPQRGFYEQIAPGAFDRSLRDGDVVQLADHDPSKPLSRMSAGTLRLSVNDDGLRVDSDLVETTYADDLIANLNAGNIRGQSFGFQVVQDDWQTEKVEANGKLTPVEVRTLQEVRLIEVSTTPFPAYPTTTADVRSARESHLVRGGLSSAEFVSDQALLELLDVSQRALALLTDPELRLGAELSAANIKTIQGVIDTLSGLVSKKAPPPETDDAFPLDLTIRLRQMSERCGLPLLT